MEQAAFAELEPGVKKRRTRREAFFEKMDGLVPWGRLEERVEAFYPKAGRGRRPCLLGVMLRVHCVQLFYNLSAPGMEDLLYEVESVRRFVGLRLSGALPDETTILPFRHLLERHGLGERLVRGDQRASGLARAPLEHGDDRGREPHRRAVVDEEPHRGAGPADAPDEEGQSVVLRDEGAPRCGGAVGLDAQSGDDAGERLGRGGDARAAARGRGAGVGRRRLSRGGQARGEPGHGRGLAGRR